MALTLIKELCNSWNREVAFMVWNALSIFVKNINISTVRTNENNYQHMKSCSAVNDGNKEVRKDVPFSKSAQ